MALSLEKKQELVGLQLAKRNVPAGILMAVELALDVSGSSRGLYKSGVMAELVDRLIPVAMRFDDNKAIGAYAFSDTAEKMDDITPDDFGSYVDNKFLRNVSRSVLWEGTNYGRALKLIRESKEPKKAGFLGGLFGKKAEKPQPSYVMFVTDGEDYGNPKAAEDEIIALGELNCYVQLIGVGRENFNWLKRMADKYSHVGFVTFPDLSKVDDEDMYAALLGEELCGWIKKQ